MPASYRQREDCLPASYRLMRLFHCTELHLASCYNTETFILITCVHTTLRRLTLTLSMFQHSTLHKSMRKCASASLFRVLL